MFERKRDACLRLPFAFPEIESVSLRAAPPVDLSCVVAILPIAELPEGIAVATAPAAVQAGGGDECQPFRGQDEFGQPVGEGLSLFKAGCCFQSRATRRVMMSSSVCPEERAEKLSDIR